MDSMWHHAGIFGNFAWCIVKCIIESMWSVFICVQIRSDTSATGSLSLILSLWWFTINTHEINALHTRKWFTLRLSWLIKQDYMDQIAHWISTGMRRQCYYAWKLKWAWSWQWNKLRNWSEWSFYFFSPGGTSAFSSILYFSLINALSTLDWYPAL